MKGIAIGKVKFFKKEQAKISDVVSDVETELKKFEEAKKKLKLSFGHFMTRLLLRQAKTMPLFFKFIS